MLKNKDGSYNKVSLFLISLIMVIVIGMFGLSLPQITEISTLDIIIIIGLAGIICFGIYRKQIFKKISSIQSVQSSILPLKSKQELKLQKDVIKLDLIKPKPNIFSLILSLIVGSVSIMVSLVIVQTIMSSLPSIPDPEFAASQASVLNVVNNGFGLLSIGLFVGVAIFIIKMVVDLIKN